MKKKAALEAIKTIRGGLDALEEAIKAPTPKKRTVKKKAATTKKKKKRRVGSVRTYDDNIIESCSYSGGGCSGRVTHNGARGRCGGSVSACGR